MKLLKTFKNIYWEKRYLSADKNNLNTSIIIFFIQVSKALYKGPDHLCLLQKNSSLLFSSCHLELAISENSWFQLFFQNNKF